MQHSHDHHDHSHTPTVTGDNERKVFVAFIITFVFMVVEVVGGYISGSLALVADAGHMLTDSVALALAFAAFRFGKKSADQKRTFGYMRFEVIAGFINAITLFGIVIWIAYEAYQRFQNPPEILAGPMLMVAVAGMLVNIFVFWFLTRGGSEHVNVKGAALHVLGDLLGSAGAILAAVIIYFTEWSLIDPILSVIVSLLILKSAWSLLRNSLHILLEGAPENISSQDIEQHLMKNVTGVARVSHVHVWLITSGRILATLHVKPAHNADAKTVVQAVEKELKAHFEIEHATVAVDWNEEQDESCSLSGTTSNHHDHASCGPKRGHGHHDH